MNEEAPETIEQKSDFPTGTSGLPRAVSPDVIELADGDDVELRIAPVVKRIGDADVRMLAYNGSIPGPTLRRPKGREITVHVRTTPTSRRRCTGTACVSTTSTTATHETQAPIPVGATSRTRCTSPTPGSTGTTRTSARTTAWTWACTATSSSSRAEPDYWPPVNRELVVTLDDVLIEDGKIAAFNRSATTLCRDGPLRQRHAHRRRDEPRAHREARRGRALLPHEHGEHPRVQRRPARGPDEARRWRQRPLRARELRRRGSPVAVGAGRGRRPVRHARATTSLEHRTPDRSYRLGVDHRGGRTSGAVARGAVRRVADERRPRGGARANGRFLEAAPDKTLAFVAEMDFDTPERAVFHAARCIRTSSGRSRDAAPSVG